MENVDKMTVVSSVFIFLIAFLVLITIFGILYVYFTNRNKERMALIERGMDPGLANGDFWVIIALIAVGMAGGLIIGDQWGSYGPLVGIIFAAVNILVYQLVKASLRKKRFNKE